MTKHKLVCSDDSLFDRVVPKYIRESILHCDEVQELRTIGPFQRKIENPHNIYRHLQVTSDMWMFRIESGNMILYLGRNKDNLFLDNFDEAWEQAKKSGFYFPKSEDIQRVLHSDTVKRFDVNTLNLIPGYAELPRDEWDDFYHLDIGNYLPRKIVRAAWNILTINTATRLTPIQTSDGGYTHIPLNSFQKDLAERLYGSGLTIRNEIHFNYSKFDNVINAMKHQYEMPYTEIKILDPDRVKKHLKKNNAEAMVGCCRTSNFYNTFNVLIGETMGNSSYWGYITGIPKYPDAAHAQK